MELTLITMLSKTKKVFTTYLPVLCSIASRNYYNGNVEVVEAFITICAAGEGGGMEITMSKFNFLLSDPTFQSFAEVAVSTEKYYILTWLTWL